MTDHATPNEPDETMLSAATAAAESIAAEGEDVRERIRHAFVRTVQERRLDIGGFGDAAEAMITGAVEGVKDAVPDRQDSVLRQVVDGLGDGIATSAHATRLALEEARGHGETFAREDLERAVSDLRALEDILVDTVTRVGKRGGSFAAAQTKALAEHARRTASKVRPSLESAVTEALRHPIRMAGEAAATTAKAAPRAAGMLLQAMSGLLQGAGDVLAGDERPKDE